MRTLCNVTLSKQENYKHILGQSLGLIYLLGQINHYLSGQAYNVVAIMILLHLALVKG